MHGAPAPATGDRGLGGAGLEGGMRAKKACSGSGRSNRRQSQPAIAVGRRGRQAARAWTLPLTVTAQAQACPACLWARSLAFIIYLSSGRPGPARVRCPACVSPLGRGSSGGGYMSVSRLSDHGAGCGGSFLWLFSQAVVVVWCLVAWWCSCVLGLG
jgi:hypothetical protein